MLVAEKQLSDPTQRIHKVLETARILYGLIHARYVLTAQGLTDMVRRATSNPVIVQGPKAAGRGAAAAPPRASPFERSRCSRPGGAPLPAIPDGRGSHVSPAQKAKYKAHEFGSCPRTLCEKQTVLPTGVSDTASLRRDPTRRAPGGPDPWYDPWYRCRADCALTLPVCVPQWREPDEAVLRQVPGFV